MTIRSISDQSKANEKRSSLISKTAQNSKKFPPWKESKKIDLSVSSSADSIHDFLPSQLFHCLAAIIAARLCANKQSLVIVCKQMIARVGGVAADVDAVGKLARKSRGGDSIAVYELVLFENVSVGEKNGKLIGRAFRPKFSDSFQLRFRSESHENPRKVNQYRETLLCQETLWKNWKNFKRFNQRICCNLSINFKNWISMLLSKLLNYQFKLSFLRCKFQFLQFSNLNSTFFNLN